MSCTTRRAANPSGSGRSPSHGRVFGCSGSNGNGYYRNRRLDRQMHRAELLELSDPARANARWESIDHELTDDGAWVPYVNEREVALVSKRLHNYEFNPVWGFLADQSWLR